MTKSVHLMQVQVNRDLIEVGKLGANYAKDGNTSDAFWKKPRCLPENIKYLLFVFIIMTIANRRH